MVMRKRTYAYKKKKPVYKTRKRAYRRKAYKARPMSTTINRVVGIPDQMFCKLRYSDTYTLGTLSSFQSVLIRANSLFDPDYAVGGHQPMGFDQYAALYGKYRVYGVAYRITCIADTPTEHVYLFLRHSNDISFTPTLTNMFEQDGTQRKILGPVGYRGTVTFKGYHSCAKALGKSKKDYDMDNATEAAVTADPAQVSYLGLYARLVNAAGGTLFDMRVLVQLVFYCKLYDRLFTPQS